MTPAQIEFYKRLARSLALQFGPNCEIVVHDLETEDMDHSIVVIENGQCTVSTGLVGEAKCLVEATGSDYLAIERNEVRPEMAFMQGKIKLSNLPEMLTLMQVFERPAE